MQVSYFETARYQVPPTMPAEWPVPPAAYDPDAGAQAYQGMVDRMQYVEELSFDWVSVSEHHYSPRILTPSTAVSASYMAARSKKIKIAVLGPIVSQSNPVQVAEELAMLDDLAQGRLVVGLLRGTTNEYLTFGLNPAEARERTTEGMELILKAWTEPQPFGWQGRHYQYRTVSVWPRPLQQPQPPTYSLGTSRESCEFAARPPYWARRFLRAVRDRRQVDAVLSRGVRALGLGADAGADALPRQHSARRDRRGRPTGPGEAAQGIGTLPVAGGGSLRSPQARFSQCRGRGADPECRRHIADVVLWQPRHGRRADQALPRGGRRRRARSGLPEPRRGRYRAPDALTRTLRRKSAAAHSRVVSARIFVRGRDRDKGRRRIQ